MQWFRMYAEVVDDDVMQLLGFDDQRHFVWLLALKCGGILDKEYPSAALRDRVIALKLGLQGDAFSNAKKRLIEVGLIDSNWQPVNWDKRQPLSDSGAERTRRYRERRAQKACDVTVTSPSRHCDGLEEEVEAERASLPRKEHGEEGPSPTTMDVPPVDSLTSPASDDPAPCPYAAIVAKYHAELPMCRRVEQLTPSRKAAMRARWRNELPTLQAFGNYFADVRGSPFLTGRVDGRDGRPPFVADLDWLLRPSNFVKVLEGKYHAR